MDLEIPNERTNWLEKWRLKAGLQVEVVEDVLRFPVGILTAYEKQGLVRVPLCNLAKLVELYGVDLGEFYFTVEEESQRIQKPTNLL